jgi:putative DNA primase/helicase
VKEYKQEMDLLAGFIEQKIEIDYDCKDKVPAQELFREYIKWAKENNEYEMSSKKFFTEISRKLPEKGRDSRGVFFRSIRILKSEETRQYSISDFHN